MDLEVPDVQGHKGTCEHKASVRSLNVYGDLVRCQAVSSAPGIHGGEKGDRVPTLRELTISKGRQTSLKEWLK